MTVLALLPFPHTRSLAHSLTTLLSSLITHSFILFFSFVEQLKMMMMNIRSKLSLQSIRSSPLRFMHATATATSEGVSGAVTEAASSTGQKVKHRVPQKRWECTQ